MKSFKKLFIITIVLFTYFSCSKDDDNDDIGETPKVVVVEEEDTLDGNYLGTWNSTTDMDITYSDFGISAKFRFADATEDKLLGEFFATSSYTSCCSSNSNDGTMVINIDGESVTSFSFNDTITDCTGSFNGTGSITINPFTIEINFTGNDCDGNHIGQMVFTRDL